MCFACKYVDAGQSTGLISTVKHCSGLTSVLQDIDEPHIGKRTETAQRAVNILLSL